MADTLICQHRWSFRKGEPMTISRAVDHALDGSDYDRGALETARAEIENLTEMMGRLVAELHEHKALDDDALCRVLGYGYEIHKDPGNDRS